MFEVKLNESYILQAEGKPAEAIEVMRGILTQTEQPFL